ncbi:MAG: 1-acyl-sn-glycerol-3-phosphate acyltransferase [Calditrichaeota bacterium]|nr:1-acyl-sn-glycerol-3-phosphate acyltransferase [Calditrichota bacterium]RQW05308.1 MAG: 1-acyl-sn-glycerol-3-phosphate acyltransferase [Calditrichota bacterium]
MAHPLVFICPVCSAEDSIRKSVCAICGQEFRITPDSITFAGKTWTLPTLKAWMINEISIQQQQSILDYRHSPIRDSAIESPLRISGRAALRQGNRQTVFQSFANIFQRAITCPVKVADGYLVISKTRFYFVTPRELKIFPLEDLTCITTNSHYFEFKMQNEPVWQIEFAEESPLKYEILFQKLVSEYYAEKGLTCIEYQPRIRFSNPDLHPLRLKLNSKSPAKETPFQSILVNFLRFILRTFFRIFIKVTVQGRNLLPEDYPFVAILNHQSIFDPFIILAFLDRRIGFLTKSTSFCGLFEQRILRLGKAIPTTRYYTDPQVIYHLRLFLGKGIPVGIFPEGERCWDGEMQKFKISVIRLLTQMEIPLVPIVIRNSFHFFPRWAKLPGHEKVELIVLPPFGIVPDLFDYETIRKFIEDQFSSILILQSEK